MPLSTFLTTAIPFSSAGLVQRCEEESRRRAVFENRFYFSRLQKLAGRDGKLLYQH